MPLYDSLTISILLFTLIFGLITCFFGYRILRFLIAVVGFMVGAVLAAIIVLNLSQESILAMKKGSDFLLIIGAGIFGGIVLSVILLFLYSAGVFLLGLLFGLVLFAGIFALFNIEIGPIFYVIPALFFGIMALYIQKFMIILMTSSIGAWLSVISIIYGLSTTFDPLSSDFINNLGDIEIYRFILGWIALSGLGFITQYFIFPKKVDNSEILRNTTQDNTNE